MVMNWFRPLHLVPPDTHINFMRIHRICFVFSLLITIASVAAIVIMGFNFGIDFAGGIVLEVKAPTPAADGWWDLVPIWDPTSTANPLRRNEPAAPR